MTMIPRPNNPIELRKSQVRRYSRNGVVSIAAGVGGGLALWWLLSPGAIFMVLGLVVAVVGGGYNFLKVNRIINHRDGQ